MSTNPKNIIRPEYLKNFTKKVKTRYILLEKGKAFSNIEQTVSSINSLTNQIIQELNLKIYNRQLPYINLQICYGKVLNKRVRVFIHNNDTSYLFERDVRSQLEAENEISHILDLLIASSYNKITISSLSCDAEIVVDAAYLTIAVVDILLDIIMFNSYSFLKKMNLCDKKLFSEQKFEFFKKQQLSCFYECSEKKLMYYSFAFSARENEFRFNVDKYIEYWNDFISMYYPNLVHIEKSIKDQIQQHVDINELLKNLQHKFKDKPEGAYLILRTNKDRTENIHPQLFSLFGLSKYRKGKIIIVPISDFEKYVPLLENLDVSAFKIVKH